METRFDHVGIAVRSLDEALPRWERALGSRASEPEEVPTQRVRVRFLPVGEGQLELLEPTSPDSAIGRFLEKRGEGLHHIALGVPNLREVLGRLEREGYRLIDREPRRGARGHWVAFAHPSALGGVLTEFVEPAGGRP